MPPAHPFPFWSYVGLAFGLFLASAILSLAARLWQADRSESEQAAALVEPVEIRIAPFLPVWRSAVLGAILGRARPAVGEMSDPRVTRGMVYNRRKKRLEISGRLSRGTFNRIFG